MTVLTRDQLDREIAERTAELDALSAALVELDTHAGLEHLRRYPPTGNTAASWVVVEAALGQMWDGLRWMTSILDGVHALRARRSKLDEADFGELTRLLRERPLTVSPDGVSLARPAIGGIGAAVERVGLADTADRVRAAYPAVAEFLCAVDEIGDQIATGVAPYIRRLDQLGVAVPDEITDLLSVSAIDPLSFSAHDVAVRLSAIARSVDIQTAERAEDAALQANWPEAIAATSEQLDILRDAIQQAAHARAHAERSIVTSPLPVSTDPEPALRDGLRVLAEPDPQALRSLRGLIATALQDARDAEEMARGLLDRRSELSGRLKAYQAKAARLGIGEDRDLLASSSIAAGLLSRKPCDLRAATRGVADYQQLVAQKRGTR